ncbi:hypothetical protein AAFP30_23740 [Gordonia sp. CPCC 205515]|uniref:hypothetical protein n=1 Tax=Gordonia sp. CPCC 205515 TaxID=3140791 RepID=UPI003AF35C6B
MRTTTNSPSPAPRTLLVVDAANVVGSKPDGWWRDRRGAAERLRDRLVPLADAGVPGVADGPVEIVMVTEGKARGVQSVPQVTIVEASGSGDDRIVEVVDARAEGRPCIVVTADRGLRARVTELGAVVVGPTALPHPA